MNFAGPIDKEIDTLTVSTETIRAVEEFARDASTNRLRLHPASAWQAWPLDARRAWCGHAGIYGIPTTELIEWLQGYCREKRCVEIGSGNADLYFHLGIKGTDSFMQVRPDIVAHMVLLGQTPTTPPEDVEKTDAENIVRKMKPDVVIGSWITERFDASRAEVGGNMYGPRTDYIIERCGTYILIGNENIHARNKALRLPHKTFHFPWLVSRAREQTKNVIYVWEKAK